MGFREWRRSRRLRREARRLLDEAFRNPDVLGGTSLRPRHAARSVLVDFDAADGRVTVVRFGIYCARPCSGHFAGVSPTIGDSGHCSAAPIRRRGGGGRVSRPMRGRVRLPRDEYSAPPAPVRVLAAVAPGHRVLALRRRAADPRSRTRDQSHPARGRRRVRLIRLVQRRGRRGRYSRQARSRW